MNLPTRLASLALVLALLAGATSHAEDNAVLYWNQQVLNATRLARNPPPIASLHLAAFHGAIYDAVNGITRTHQPWNGREAAPADTNMDAAIASAGFTVLNALWGQASNPRNFQLAYDKALAGIPEGPGKASGIAFGKKIADAALALRAKSGWNKVAEGTFTSNEPGKWRETPPGFRPAVTPQLATTTPFVMKSPDQFRAPPPPKVESREYAEEIAFVAKVGARDNAERTEYQTLSTPFWADDLGTATPAGHWNTIAQDLARRQKLDTTACARLFALLNFACADAGISCWETKFFYCTCRPETALRELDRKVNPFVVNQPDFIPNMAAPAHPDYTSGHSTFTGAATRVLERYFKTDELEFTTTSDGLPGAVRTFKKLSDARQEIGMSRVYAGIHTMSANLEGQKAGIRVADYVFDNALLPTRDWTSQ